MTNKLLDRLINVGSIKDAAILSQSDLFNERDIITTDYPILNIACSGEVDGGFHSAGTMAFGESRTFKSLIGLVMMETYLRKYPDSIALLYDSEFGTTKSYYRNRGIDTNRVIHLPIENIEQLTFDVRKKLEEIKKGDKVFIMLDSLGNSASLKEATDTLNEKSVRDMSRPSAIKAFFRIITPHLAKKDIPFFVITHAYKSMDLFPVDVPNGGNGGIYNSDSIFLITKATEKDSQSKLLGNTFTLNIYKSRFVKEKSKFPLTVYFDKGISKWSGMLEIAKEGGFLTSPKMGYYEWTNKETGEVHTSTVRARKIDNDDAFWKDLVYSPAFKEYVHNRYSLDSVYTSDDSETEDE